MTHGKPPQPEHCTRHKSLRVGMMRMALQAGSPLPGDLWFDSGCRERRRVGARPTEGAAPYKLLRWQHLLRRRHIWPDVWHLQVCHLLAIQLLTEQHTWSLSAFMQRWREAAPEARSSPCLAALPALDAVHPDTGDVLHDRAWSQPWTRCGARCL